MGYVDFMFYVCVCMWKFYFALTMKKGEISCADDDFITKVSFNFRLTFLGINGFSICSQCVYVGGRKSDGKW
jgi:hypothetical protein